MASDTSCRKVHSILVQLPLPEHIDSALVLSKIRVDKDLVDPGGLGDRAVEIPELERNIYRKPPN